jgi:hypothetical protein
MVDSKMVEFAWMVEVIYNIVQSCPLVKTTDRALELIEYAILEECGPYISDLSLKTTPHEGVIRIMFKMSGVTMEVDYSLPPWFTSTARAGSV